VGDESFHGHSFPHFILPRSLPAGQWKRVGTEHKRLRFPEPDVCGIPARPNWVRKIVYNTCHTANTKLPRTSGIDDMDKILALPIWVLNLKQDRDRLRFMRRQFLRLHLPFTIIEAVDGARLTREELGMYSKDRAIEYSNRELSPGEIATSLSHARMWERMLRDNLKEVLIFEDDVLIAEALVDILRNRHRLPKDWELINFSTDTPQAPFGEFLTDIYRASHHKDWADRASAYLLNPKGARKLLAYVYPIGHTADGLTWRTDITGLVSYGVYPRVVILSDLESSIWKKGEIPKRSFLNRKGAELMAIIKSIARFFGLTQLFKKITGR
jgi:GR25 family glycosyltransferase involved in LPS biosynthesis